MRGTVNGVFSFIDNEGRKCIITDDSTTEFQLDQAVYTTEVPKGPTLTLDTRPLCRAQNGVFSCDKPYGHEEDEHEAYYGWGGDSITWER